MPPWLADIHAGLQGLHDKADRQYSDIVAGLQTQGVRLSHLETVTAEHTKRHEQSDSRLSSIETKLKELETLKDNLSRSPRQAIAPRSPRSPRSSRNQHAGSEVFGDEDLDFDLVAGGWIDAKRDDAIQEARNILKDANVLDQVEEVWAPYSRTSFVKIKLILDHSSSIAIKRRTQKTILDKLKMKKYVSGVVGSENIKLWVTRSKTPEERKMTRAIVLCKTFYCRLPHKDPTQPNPFSEQTVEISWNGKVFIGRHQMLGNVYRDGEPAVFDLILTDNRGNHLDWYIIAKAFSQATGRTEDELQTVWDTHGPSTDRPE